MEYIDYGERRLKKKIVSVFSGKGGVGKTLASIELASQLGEIENRVLLVDCDLGGANVSYKLLEHQEEPYRKVLRDVIFNKDLSLKDIVIPRKLNFFLVPGRAGDYKYANINYGRFKRFATQIKRISEDYDYVLLDIQAGVNRIVIDFALLFDERILVTTQEDTEVIFGYKCIEACLQRKIETEERLEKRMKNEGKNYEKDYTLDVKLIINRVKDSKEGDFVFEALEQIIEEYPNKDYKPYKIVVEHLGSIISDKKIIDKAYSYSSSVSNYKRNSEISVNCRNIANKLDNREGHNKHKDMKWLTRHIYDIFH